jgi:CRP/FNR family transcriptional regulator
MASSQTVSEIPIALEDPIAHLPRAGIVAYKKGRSIFHQGQPSTSLYRVIDGRVKVARLANDGRETIVDIYRTGDFFGEFALLGLPRTLEQATAMEDTKVMAWSAARIRTIFETRPKLAIALLQIVMLRSLECGHRIESLSVDSAERRLARALIYLSRRLGVAEPDGAYRMPPFTHELLAQYVGASRELVTQCMNTFRKQGYVGYSRDAIVLYRGAFDGWLDRIGTHVAKTRLDPRGADGDLTETVALKRA